MRTEKLSLGVLTLILMVVMRVAVHAAETVKPLSLPDSIDLALKQSVLLHAAKEGVRGAEAQRKEAFTGFLPKFSTSYSYTPPQY
jgi:outer membrane protein